jgi:hypothetical protein
LHSFPFSTSTTPPCLANLILATCKALCSFLLVPPKGAQVRGSLSSWSSAGRNASPQPSSSQFILANKNIGLGENGKIWNCFSAEISWLSLGAYWIPPYY